MIERLRRIATVLAGLVAGVIVILAVEAIGHVAYPVPAGLDLSDPDQIRRLAESAPVGALLVVVLAWASGSFVAGLVAGLVAPSERERHAVVTGILLMLSGLLNLLLVPGHPLWFWILGLAVFVPGSWAGARASLSMRSPATTATYTPSEPESRDAGFTGR